MATATQHTPSDSFAPGAGADRPWFIYVLKDPRTDEVRYVGWTINPKRRFQNHVHEKAPDHKARWVQSLLRAGLQPSGEIVETGLGPGWADRERWWIKYHREHGSRLTNIADGGQGTPGAQHTPESIQKCREAKLGKRATAETKLKMSLARKGRKVSDATRAKLSAIKLGVKRSPEAVERCAAGHRGKKKSPEWIAKMAAGHRGLKRPEEAIRRTSEGLRKYHARRRAEAMRGQAALEFSS